ncbi:type II secretion system protein N [Hydrogenimonas sp.]
MSRRFEKLYSIAAWFILVALAAKFAALVVDAFLPPTAPLDCTVAVRQTVIRYPFVKAFGLRQERITRKTKPPKKTTTLKGYTLTMTAIGNPSMAIIAHGKKSRLLAIGDTIDGFVLKEVFTDRIKLLKNGKEYWLTMKKSKGPSFALAKKKEKKSDEVLELTERIRKEGDTYYIPRELLHKMHDIKKIFRYISINPVYKSNKLVGFGITDIKKGSVFDKMGLHKRDIIEKIDGKSITNESDIFKYFNKIDELNSLSLTIKRGSRRRELHYEIY